LLPKMSVFVTMWTCSNITMIMNNLEQSFGQSTCIIFMKLVFS